MELRQVLLRPRRCRRSRRGGCSRRWSCARFSSGTRHCFRSARRRDRTRLSNSRSPYLPGQAASPGGATGSGPGCLPGRPGYWGVGRGAIHPNRPCFSTDPSHSNGLRSCATDPLVPTPELKPEVCEPGRISGTPGPIIGLCDELAPGGNWALACGAATGRLRLELGSSCAFAAQLVQAANPINVSVPSPFQFFPI